MIIIIKSVHSMVFHWRKFTSMLARNLIQWRKKMFFTGGAANVGLDYKYFITYHRWLKHLKFRGLSVR